MSRTIAPPRQSAPATADALFAEARRRRRRRRLAGLAVVLALTAAVAVAFILARPNRAPTAAGADRGRARPVTTPGTALAGSVAWVDYNGRVHLGDLATGAQQVIARSKADPAIPLVQAGGRPQRGSGAEPGNQQGPVCGARSGLRVRGRAARVFRADGHAHRRA